MSHENKKWTYHPLLKFISMLLIAASIIVIIASGIVFDRLGYAINRESFYETASFENLVLDVLESAHENGIILVSPENIAEMPIDEASRRSNLLAYQYNLAELNKYSEIKYYFEDFKTGKVASNIDQYAKDDATGIIKYNDITTMLGKYEVSYSKSAVKNARLNFQYSYSERFSDEDLRIQVGVDTSNVDPSSVLGKLVAQYDRDRQYTIYGMIAAVIAGFTLLFNVIYMIVVTGKRHPNSEVKLIWIDRVATDMLILLMVLFDGAIIMTGANIFYYSPFTSNLLVYFGLIVGVSCIIIIMHFVILLSLVRRVKLKVFFSSMLIVRMLKWIFLKMVKPLSKTLFSGIRYMPIQILVYLGFLMANLLLLVGIFSYYDGLRLISFGLFALLNLLALIIYVKVYTSFKTIKHSIKMMSEGNLEVNLSEYKVIPQLSNVVDDLGKIHQAAVNAGEEAVQNEKFKVGLIANISHDLKTPLTSIITYVNLLDDLELSNEDATNYVDVLKDKSWRMKELIDDVIEVNKTQTGNLKMTMQEIDASEFLNQVIGEFKERFDNVPLKAVISIPKEPVLINADGNHLRRVFENLFENIVRYSMPGTRVYIESKIDNQYLVTEIKNIAAEPVQIQSSEAKERFTRGDSSRTTEGSGLGLAIADGIVKQHHGILDIHVDGDLFKTIVKLKMK